MNYLSLFSGAGGFEWFGKLMGWRCVGYVERNEYCQQVIRARIRDGIFDDAPIFPDVRTFDGVPYRGRVDCITAGFPCQPFSVAGRKLAEDDERNCWPDTLRALREVRPPMALFENVPGLLGEQHGYFGTILGELAESGYNARWTCLSAASVSAPHVRDRLWVLATDADGDRPEADIQLRPRSENAVAGGRGAAVADPAELSEREPADEADAEPACRGTWKKPRGGSWWNTEPDVGRVADGVAARVHRLTALGNGIVPAVARAAWETLTSDS